MKKSTYELYNLDPAQLRALQYEDALNLKVMGAQFAMKQYADFAKKSLEAKDGRYEEWLEKYQASDKARQHNLDLLEELRNDE